MTPQTELKIQEVIPTIPTPSEPPVQFTIGCPCGLSWKDCIASDSCPGDSVMRTAPRKCLHPNFCTAPYCEC